MWLSASKMKAFKACRRMYELKYVENLEPVERVNALEIGTNYHSLIERLNEDGGLPGGVFTKEMAMAKAYQKYIYPKFKMVESEKPVMYQLGDGDVLRGIVDGIAADGHIVEHKSTGLEITEQYEYNLLWDEQILAYMLMTGLRKVWYTVCRKPTIKQRQDESDEDYFRRMVEWYDTDTDSKIRLLEIERTDQEVEQFLKDVLAMKGTVQEAEADKNFYRNTCHCNAWGRRCEYSSICLNYDPKVECIEFVHREQER